MRSGDTLGLNVIRGIKAAVLAQETRGARTTLDDDAIIAVIAREVKERKDALVEFERGGRRDLMDKMQAEIERLQQYLPRPLTNEEIDAAITEAIAETGAAGPRDMGKVMGVLNPRLRGRADGRVVADRVKACLARTV